MTPKQHSATYDYRKVICTCCGWHGRRGYRLIGPACPQCGISSENIIFEQREDRERKLQYQTWIHD
jgi:hypothetical protein